MTGRETIQLLDYLRAVRQRWRLVVLIVALCTGVALMVSLSSEKQYDATAQLLLRGEEPINSLLNPNGTAASQDPERDLNTDVQLIEVGPTAHLVQRQLGLTRSTDRLLDQIEAETSSDSDIVKLRARDHDPVLAARIANAFAEAYVQVRINSARARYRQAADLAQRQVLALSPADRRTDQGTELRARQRELQIAAALQTGGVELVRRASVPTHPSRPRPKLSAALGIVLGLLLGLGVALALNLIDRRFKDEQEMEDFFGLPILASIPRPGRRATALDDPAQREAYGLLAANLRLAAAGRGSSVVMITSPSPGEGKTSVTLGVARAYARLGLSVVAIEADLRRPAFGRFADVSSSGGLTGVLAGGSLANELLWLDADTLGPSGRDAGARGAIGLLPAGGGRDNPQRTLSDPGMRLVVEVARTMADVVLVDTAPLGTVNDAAMLASLVDAVALVVRLNQTTKDAGRRAIRTLGNLGPDILGLVVTDAAASERHVYYASSASPTTGVPAATARSATD
ncbi:MAG: Wzz/FepE/Etk N-terminal domain-containing protein [Actinomycetota bacterium]|nr:Wzz/FepE/Etk N-terminal domain-containing protein [Actinomycetota bacterium]